MAPLPTRKNGALGQLSTGKRQGDLCVCNKSAKLQPSKQWQPIDKSNKTLKFTQVQGLKNKVKHTVCKILRRN